MSARLHLRAATAEAHERVDALFSGIDLADPAQYRRFLSAQAAAHLPVETAIDRGATTTLLPDWPQRRRSELLLADLAELGEPAPPLLPAPDLASMSALLGAVYVLEGSRLGGVYLERSLPGEMPRRFLAAQQARGAWRNLLALLDQELGESQALREATDSAVRIFKLFETAARRHVAA